MPSAASIALRPDVAPQARSWTALLFAGLAAHAIVAAVCVASPAGHVNDFARFWTIATSPGHAYRDYAVEYPPGALAAFVGLARLSPSPAAFTDWMLLVNLSADAAIVAALLWGWGIAPAAVFASLTLPILSLLYFRMDLWSIAAATAALAAGVRGRRYTGAALFAAGVALKLWPLPLGAVLAARAWRERRPGPARLFAGLVAGGAAVWLAWSGIDGIRQVLTFRGATGWEIESLVGSVWRAFEPASVRLESGAIRAGWSHPALSAALFALSAPPAAWAAWRGAATGREGAGWIAAVGTLLSCSALLSPQFIGWLVPGAAVAWSEDDRRSTALVALVVVVTLGYRVMRTLTAPGLVIARNVLLLVATAHAYRRLRPQARQQFPIG